MLELSDLYRKAAALGPSDSADLALKESLRWAEEAAAAGDGRGVYTLAGMLEEQGKNQRREAYAVSASSTCPRRREAKRGVAACRDAFSLRRCGADVLGAGR